MRLTQRRVILVKKETTYKTDPTPTAAANAIWCNTSAVMSPQGEEVSRDVVRSIWSSQGHIVTGVHNTITVEAELKGSGTAGVAPEFGPLLEACAMPETVVEDTSVAYKSTTVQPDSQESVTIYWYEDGALHKMIGCRGTVSMSASNNALGKLTFTLSGLYVAPEDASIVTPTLSSVIPPVCNDMSMTIGSYTPVVTSLAWDLGNTVAKRPDINADEGIAGFIITDREVTGSVDPEADAFSSFNPWADWKAGTTAALSATIGSTAGNICAVSCPVIQYKAPSYGDREGIRTYDLPFVARDNAGAEELVLTFT